MLNQKIILLMIFSIFLIGCRAAVPIIDITDAPITTGSGKSPSLSVVTHDIVQAGIGLGWQMKKENPGHIIATLVLRKHMVKVDINYSNTEYSILYKDSTEMNYDGEKIHANYNSWVQNLSKSINKHVYHNNG
jgi:hypothetical protein